MSTGAIYTQRRPLIGGSRTSFANAILRVNRIREIVNGIKPSVSIPLDSGKIRAPYPDKPRQRGQ